jgi:hypothetical protein
MKFVSGKHAGMTLDEVLLKKPDFARWYTRNFPESAHAKEFNRLAHVFATKPFLVKCEGNCGMVATRASAYRDSPDLMFWCDGCDPYSSGANSGKLRVVKTLKDALDHIELTAEGNRSFSRTIVRNLANAKGLPKRVGASHAVAFFQT